MRKGLPASHVAIEDTPIRVHLPASIVIKALRMSHALRLQLTDASTRAAVQANPARGLVRLLRTCHVVVLLYLLFSRMGSGIECLRKDLVASEEDRIRLYHRAIRGQRGVSAECKLLCHLPPTVHTEIIQMLLFFDFIRHTLAGEKYPTTRWAIDDSEKHEKWTAITLAGWLNEVTSAMRERPPP
jgi:hypothetical protein